MSAAKISGVYQLYQINKLMLGHKAQIPCDSWVGLSQYGFCESVSKDSLVKQYELVQVANNWALNAFDKAHR